MHTNINAAKCASFVTVVMGFLATRLDERMSEYFAATYAGQDWFDAFLEHYHPRTSKEVKRTDVSIQLLALYMYYGNIQPFRDNDQMVNVPAYAARLRDIRNNWAHTEELTVDDCVTVAHSASALLKAFNDDRGVAALKTYVYEADAIARTNEPAPGQVEQPCAGGVCARAFVPWTVKEIGTPAMLDNMRSKASREAVAEVAIQVVRVEGPVHIDRVSRLIKKACGRKRLSRSSAAALRRQLENLDTITLDGEGFLWPADIDPTIWRVFRPNTTVGSRPLKEVSSVELANAWRYVQANNPDASEQEWIAKLAWLFDRKTLRRGDRDRLIQARRLMGTQSDMGLVR
ncbi:DUF3320 domain-containing protein [Corynebacterium mendelii]|uniref:DUF3320 domain-containing protein n=1 Tax=Corynebacterium mendelii TaxID=2765362 RepID=A0A939DY34_9CORY|nr:DUF3320 domain-containing protein [Corynebacterium mendelii]MBN9643359.1 DUF3320 domain-containing protein [Corynebacterium mendelii]